jgi:hypothetical protein
LEKKEKDYERVKRINWTDDYMLVEIQDYIHTEAKYQVLFIIKRQKLDKFQLSYTFII